MNQPISSQKCTVLTTTFESRGRQDCLVQMAQNGEIRMRYQLRLSKTSHQQVGTIIEQLRLRIDRMHLPSVVRIDRHGSAGNRGYLVYTPPLHQVESAKISAFGNQFAVDPLRYILRLARRLEAAGQHNLFHQTLSPQSIYHYGNGQFLLLGLGIPALGAKLSLFSAPEVTRTGQINESATIYALGMMLFAQYGGTFLLGGQDRFRIHNRPYLDDTTLKLHSAVKGLINRSTQINPAERTTDLRTFCHDVSETIQSQIQLTQRIGNSLSGLKRRVQRAARPTHANRELITGAHLIPMHSAD
ncbi:MAG: hypothetical protein ACPG8W_04230 [Candidatus Promineifilaceae bacterium]